MLPMPTTPSVLPASSRPWNFFFSHLPALTLAVAAATWRVTLIDYDREMALVAIHRERQDGPQGETIEIERVVGVSRYITNPDKSSCEFSLVVADDFNGKGLGSRLMLSITSAHAVCNPRGHKCVPTLTFVDFKHKFEQNKFTVAEVGIRGTLNEQSQYNLGDE